MKNAALSMVGIVLVGLLWAILSSTVAKDLPSPVKTWQESKRYIVEPWEKRGEMDQGILRMAAYSLLRVAKGFSLAILIGAPLGFLLGMSSPERRGKIEISQPCYLRAPGPWPIH